MNLASTRTLWRQQALRWRCGQLPSRLRRALASVADPIPVLMVCYNNGRYVAHLATQLNERGLTPVVLDNHSTDLATQAALQRLHQAGQIRHVMSPKNFGHMVGFLSPVYDCLPELFAYTDPDLDLSPGMPDEFLTVLAGLTERYGVYKAGLALTLRSDTPMTPALVHIHAKRPFAFERHYDVREWESNYWRRPLVHETLQVHAAPVDTTLAVYRKYNFRGQFTDGVRVAGAFEAVHLPWYPALDILDERDKAAYLRGNKSSNWVVPIRRGRGLWQRK